jgi:hypothetical protein
MESRHRFDILCARMEALVKRELHQARMKVHEWIMPDEEEVPMPPDGYIVSSTPFHEHGLAVPPFDSFRGCYTTTALSYST